MRKSMTVKLGSNYIVVQLVVHGYKGQCFEDIPSLQFKDFFRKTVIDKLFEVHSVYETQGATNSILCKWTFPIAVDASQIDDELIMLIRKGAIRHFESLNFMVKDAVCRKGEDYDYSSVCLETAKNIRSITNTLELCADLLGLEINIKTHP